MMIARRSLDCMLCVPSRGTSADPPEGHHKRVDVLLQKIESCTVIVSQLREREKEAERLSTDGRQRIEPEARPRRAFTRPDATPAWAPPSQPRPYQRPSPQHGWNCAPPDAAQWRGRNMVPEDGGSSGYTFTQVIIAALVRAVCAFIRKLY